MNEWQHLGDKYGKGGINLLESFYSDPKRWGFSFEFYSMLTKIKTLLERANSEKSIIIIERSILSNKIFKEISANMGKLDKMEHCMLMNVYNFYIRHIYPQISGIIYLDTPIDECLTRISKRNRKEECAIEKSYLVLIKKKYDELFDSFSAKIKVLRIDGMYDCEKDSDVICGKISTFIQRNQSTTYALSFEGK